MRGKGDLMHIQKARALVIVCCAQLIKSQGAANNKRNKIRFIAF